MTFFTFPFPAVDGDLYLNHLDGIRALAVLGVLCFHFGIDPFRGGDTGVDVFFVLSGFLMTKVITSNLNKEKFSLVNFASRRFWRLYPSVIVTVLSALVLSFLIEDEIIMHNTAKSALFALFSSSNFSFYAEAGYFDSSSLTKPLLHTWSLAVEEQFYLVWPISLMLLHRISRGTSSLLTFCLAAGLISFFASSATKDASLRFYMLPFRIFEFCAGAAAYTLFPFTKMVNAPFQTVAASLGFALIFLSYVTAPAVGTAAVKTFPSSTYYSATFGSFLLTLSPDAFLLGHILSSKPAAHIGKLSYALYLVHWVVKVFVDQVLLRFPVLLLSREALYVSLTVLFSYMLHFLCEEPLRHCQPRPTRALLVSVLLCLAVCQAGLQMSSQIGSLRSRMTKAPLISERAICESQAKRPGEYIFAVGSSYAAQLFTPLDQFSCRGRDYNISDLWGCPLYMRNSTWMHDRPRNEINVGWGINRAVDKRAECDRSNLDRWKYMEKLATEKRPTVVVLSHRWEAMFQSNISISTGSMARYLKEVVRDVSDLGHSVLIVGSTPGNFPTWPESLVCWLEQQKKKGSSNGKAVRQCPVFGKPNEQAAWVNNAMKDTMSELQLSKHYLDMFNYLCVPSNHEICYITSPRSPTAASLMYLRRDGFHLSLVGAEYVTDALWGAIESVRLLNIHP